MDLAKLTVAQLRIQLCEHDVPFTARDKKTDLIYLLDQHLHPNKAIVPFDILRQAAAAHLSIFDQIRLEIAIRDRDSLPNIRRLAAPLAPLPSPFPAKPWNHAWKVSTSNVTISHIPPHTKYNNEDNVLELHHTPSESGIYLKVQIHPQTHRMITTFYLDIQYAYDPDAMDLDLSYFHVALHWLKPLLPAPEPRTSIYFNEIRRKTLTLSITMHRTSYLPATDTRDSWRFIKRWAKKLTPIFTRATPYMSRF